MKNIKFNEDGFNDFLKELISSGMLEAKEEGISKLVIDKGYEALSEKQRYVFDKMIENNHKENCARCGSPISWNEMFEALNNGGLCNYCEYMQYKNDKD